MTVSLTGAAAATNAPLEVAANDLSSTVIYHGQELKVDVTGASFTVNDGEDVFLYEIENGEFEEIYDTETVESGEVQFDTSVLDGSGQFAINDQSSYTKDQASFAVLTQEFDATWSQETVTASDESVPLELSSNRDSTYNVTISAERIETNESLDYDELKALFIHQGTDLKEVTDPNHLPLDRLGFDRDEGDGVDELRNNDYITLNLSTSTEFSNDDEIVANFANYDADEGLETGQEFEFNVTVTDTGVSDTATVNTDEKAVEFDQDLYTRAAGDLARFTVSLGASDEAWVQFADPAGSFVDILYLSDGDGDNEVTFTVNTRLVGTDHTNVGSADSDVVYFSDDDTVSSYIHDEAIEGKNTAVTQATFYKDSVENANKLNSFTKYLEEIHGKKPTEQLSRPLQPADYELVVANNRQFVAKDGDPTVHKSIGAAEFDLVQPSIRSVHTWTAPQEEANAIRDTTSLQQQLTGRNEISIGDRAVVQFNATGLVGALATIDYLKNGNDITDGLEDGFQPDVLHELAMNDGDWEGEGIHLAFEGEERPNRDRNTLTLGGTQENDAYTLVGQQTAEDNTGTFYLVIDTDAEPFADGLSDGERFNASLTYEAINGRFAFDSASGPLGGQSGDSTNPAYPYFPSEFTRNVTESAKITFAKSTASFANSDGDTVQVAPEADALVSGWTNVAPGSNARVSVRLAPPDSDLPEEDHSFLARKSVEIADDGSFSTELDLSSRVVGEEGTIQFTVGDETITTSDVVFRDIRGVQSPFFDVRLDAPVEIAPNGTAEVSATVTNTGDQAGTGDLSLTVDGSMAVRGVFDLDRGQSESVTHNVSATGDSIELVASSQNTTANATILVAGEAGQSNATTVTAQPTTSNGTSTATPDESTESGPTMTTAQPDGGGGGGIGASDIVLGVGVISLLGGGIVLFQRWNSV